MIQLIEAPPRSGKTFYFVKYLSKFWAFDDLYREFILDSNVLIISNVEGLKVRHWKYPECLKGRSVAEFFTIANFEAIMEKTGKNHIILGLDEVHEIFPPSFKNEEVVKFFAFHGHIGIDVFLMTQGISMMTRSFNSCLEFIVKVKPRSQKLYKTFTYDFYSLTGIKLYSKTIKNDASVFSAYKSFRQDEHNKPRSAVALYLAFSILMLVCAGGMFTYAIKTFGGEKAQPVNQIVRATRADLPPLAVVEPESIPEPVLEPIAVAVAEDYGEKWRVYYLQGYYESSEERIFIINGRIIKDSDNFRNFSEATNTVEHYGQLIQGAEVQPVAPRYQLPG